MTSLFPLLDANGAVEYLRGAGRLAPSEPVAVRELAGGVSNVVLYVTRPDVPGGDFVLKQARGQLRVEQPWFCSIERIWREVETLQVCQEALSSAGSLCEPSSLAATTPQVLWEDRANYVFAMSAAPPHSVWKADLLAGTADARIASACGSLLGRLHVGTWGHADVAHRLADKTFFVDLRVDPYYRRVAAIHPKLRPQLEQLTHSVTETSLALVHGDFSPKNLLVYDGGLMLVDCEVGHYGDPAFDLGFFLTHLCLKAVLKAPQHDPYLALIQTFWHSYESAVRPVVSESELRDLSRRAMHNLAGCVLARVDGKSPVEYLNDLGLQEAARGFSYRLFQEPRAAWDQAEPLLRGICESLPDATNRQNSRP